MGRGQARSGAEELSVAAVPPEAAGVDAWLVGALVRLLDQGKAGLFAVQGKQAGPVDRDVFRAVGPGGLLEDRRMVEVPVLGVVVVTGGGDGADRRGERQVLRLETGQLVPVVALALSFWQANDGLPNGFRGAMG
jgi:hypothetical protein